MSSRQPQRIQTEAREGNQHLAVEFKTLVREEHSALERYCYMLTGSPLDAQDLAQETWLKVYTAFSHVQNAAKPRSYIRKIAMNQWTDHVRRNTIPTAALGEDQSVLTDERNRLETKAALEVMVRHLPPRQQAAFLLTEALQFTARETAELLDTTEGAVKALLSRARATLRDVRRTMDHDANEDAAHGQVRDPLEATVVEAYFEALEEGDAEAILTVAGVQMEDTASNPQAVLSSGPCLCMAA